MDIRLNSNDSPTELHLTPENQSEAWDLGAIVAILLLRGIKHKVDNAGDDRLSLALPVLEPIVDPSTIV